MFFVFRRLLPHLREVIASLVVASVLFGAAPAGAAPDSGLPGSDETIAISRETNLELSNPSGPDRLPELKSKAASAISLRQSRLVELGKRAARDGDCSRPVLAEHVSADANALSAIGAQLAAETDVKRAREVYRRIYTDLRVYALENPRVALSTACSVIVNRGLLLQGRIAALTASPPNGADPATVMGTLADLPSRVEAIADRAREAVEAVTVLEPDKGDKQVLTANVAALRAAQEGLKAVDAEFSAVDAVLDGLRKGNVRVLKRSVRNPTAASGS